MPPRAGQLFDIWKECHKSDNFLKKVSRSAFAKLNFSL